MKNPQQLVTITSDTALRHGFQAGAGWSYPKWDRLRQALANIQYTIRDGKFIYSASR